MEVTFKQIYIYEGKRKIINRKINNSNELYDDI